MAKKIPILPSTPTRRVNEQIDPYLGTKPTIPEDAINRGNQIALDQKPFSINLEDIDDSVFFYFKNVIKPYVIQNGNRIEVPVEYSSQERWVSVQKNGYFRDKNGKIMYPYIMVRRTGFEKNRELTNKLDGNNINNFSISKSRYNPKNQYNRFDILNNTTPSEKFYMTPVPDYIILKYDCVVLTNFIQENNKIVEAIEFASDSYWGDVNRFQFRTFIDNFESSSEYSVDEERIAKTSLSLTLYGYIIPDIEMRTKSTNGKQQFYSKSHVSIITETVYKKP